ncbi:ArnT family glycosyltransferase [Solitalea lacus]|uniref:ArnT family glycosyltransferase n=1 Tax=Solitalea lacus TaxID=2911172 RepID=UPI001EDB22C5|nr:glycosyltransferase family 39 protein [Solitalea lacus]UKJ08549.1 glycosyltransferase family 39 protein [Solitalea lacus]
MKNYLRDYFALLFVFTTVMLLTNGLWGVLETSEARYAEIAREMFHSKNWVEPTLLDIHHFHKPPLTYWITTLSFQLFGVSSFAARFFLVVAYAVQVYLIFIISLSLFSQPKIAKYAALIYATLPIVLISVRTLTTDAYLNTFILLTIFGWIRFSQTQQTKYLWITAVAAALGFLTKGHAVFVVPFFAMIGMMKILPKPPLFKFQYLIAIAAFTIISFSWFYLVTRSNNGLGQYFILKHMFDRYFHAEVFSRSQPFYYYLLVFPMVTLPWFPFFIKNIFKRTQQSFSDQKTVYNILVWWLLIPFIVYSISSSKLTLYILPLSSGFSLVTAYYFDQALNAIWKWVIFIIHCLIFLAISLLNFFNTNFTVPEWLYFVPAIAFLVGLLTCVLVKQEQKAIGLLNISFALTLLLYSSFFLHYNSFKANSIRPIASFIKANSLNRSNILVYDKFLPSLAFELNTDIISIYNTENSLKRETQFERTNAWKKHLINLHEQGDISYLKKLMEKKNVIVTQSELPPEIKLLMNGQWNRKSLDKWVIYYN